MQKKGLKGRDHETGEGQWERALHGVRLSGSDCKVYMVKVSYEPETFPARSDAYLRAHTVTTSPSMDRRSEKTDSRRASGTTGRLWLRDLRGGGSGDSTPGYRLCWQCANQVLLHQSVIGLEGKSGYG